MLAGLLRAPSRFAPTNDLARAQERAKTIIGLMEDQGYLKFYSHTRPADSGVAEVPDRERGWTHIHLSNPGGGGHANTDTVPGLLNGYLQYFRWQYVQFGLQLLGKPDKSYTPSTFADACQVQAVTDAIYRSGLKDGELTKVAKV